MRLPLSVRLLGKTSQVCQTCEVYRQENTVFPVSLF